MVHKTRSLCFLLQSVTATFLPLLSPPAYCVSPNAGCGGMRGGKQRQEEEEEKEEEDSVENECIERGREERGKLKVDESERNQLHVKEGESRKAAMKSNYDCEGGGGGRGEKKTGWR